MKGTEGDEKKKKKDSYIGRRSDKIQWLNGVYAKDEKKMQKKRNHDVDVKRDKRITETEGRV